MNFNNSILCEKKGRKNMKTNFYPNVSIGFQGIPTRPLQKAAGTVAKNIGGTDVFQKRIPWYGDVKMTPEVEKLLEVPDYAGRRDVFLKQVHDSADYFKDPGEMLSIPIPELLSKDVSGKLPLRTKMFIRRNQPISHQVYDPETRHLIKSIVKEEGSGRLMVAEYKNGIADVINYISPDGKVTKCNASDCANDLAIIESWQPKLSELTAS